MHLNVLRRYGGVGRRGGASTDGRTRQRAEPYTLHRRSASGGHERDAFGSLPTVRCFHRIPAEFPRQRAHPASLTLYRTLKIPRSLLHPSPPRPRRRSEEQRHRFRLVRLDDSGGRRQGGARRLPRRSRCADEGQLGQAGLGAPSPIVPAMLLFARSGAKCITRHSTTARGVESGRCLLRASLRVC